MFQRVLTGREMRLGPDYHNTLRTVHGLADVFHREGNFEESERLYNRALKGLEKQLGKDHPKTFAVVEKLATNYLSQRKYEMAETLFFRALSGRQQCLGPSHADTLQTSDKLKRREQMQERSGRVMRDERSFISSAGAGGFLLAFLELRTTSVSF
jgi:tetratricopeptide (TPR) repeat protein